MKPEELLKRRIRLKADWPGCQWAVGTIFPDNFADFKKWPHLFEELPWWAEREEKDMPEYIIGRHRGEDNYVKVYKWFFGSTYPMTTVDSVEYYAPYCTPIPESEYNEYLKQSTQ